MTIANSSAFYLLGNERKGFTTTKLTYTFDEGMPTDVSLEQPSEWPAGANLPLDVIKAMINVTKELVKHRVDYSEDRNALIE